jgi:glycosyltransferase involved in cell wall biosynthesis
MPAVYAAADLLVLPSESETWGLVANEALACGVPILVSDACGCSADLADGTVGLSYPTACAEPLAAAMRRFLASPPASTAIAAKAAQYSVTAAADGIMAAAYTTTAHQAARK